MKKDKIKKLDRIEVIRHSTAHVLAGAVLEMFPEAKFGIGPAIKNGFFYDFELPRTLVPEDLEIIEEKMKKIIEKNFPFERRVVTPEEALKKFKLLNQIYKVELIEDLIKEKKKKITLYKSGNFVDLCSGPHLDSTGEIPKKNLKLIKISGAYWKGKENNPQLQRIYGVVFEKKEDLEKYLKNLEEAKKRNHIAIGKKMELFANFSEIGQGLPVWLPNGFVIRRELEDFMIKFERKFGYQHIITPHLNRKELFEISGHWNFYSNSMYPPLEISQSLKDLQEGNHSKVKETFLLKPMNCPATMIVYKMKPRSYKELPLKIGELGTVYRYEKSGELHGLQRVRGFTQNDAHIFCTPSQLEEVFTEVLEMLIKFYQIIGFDKYHFRLSLADFEKEKYIGSQKKWQEAEEILEKVVNKVKINFSKEKGEAAFYGPKLDVQAVNVFGKEDTISTIQIDFNLPKQFKLSYINQKGEKKQPFVIHRALIGSFERFFAFLIEHYGGSFPFWLAPTQIAILPISEKNKNYAQKINLLLLKKEIRTKIFDEEETLGKRIAQASQEKIPYLLIVGEKETKNQSVSLRLRENPKNQKEISLKELERRINKELERKLN